MQRIGSRDNPLVKRVRALGRSARECRKSGETLLDGPHLVAEALRAAVPIKALLVAESAIARPEPAQLCETLDEVVRLLPDELFRQLSPVDTPSGLLALIDQPAAAQAVPDRDLVVLDAVQDAGNVGTILRTAAAAGVRQAVLTEGCAQAWSPKVLRAGMGAHFRIGIVEHADVAALLKDYAGIVAATVLGPDAGELYRCDLSGPVAWLFGSEGAGVSAGLAALATHRVAIPMAAQVESLNVACAAAICLFEQLRQRRAA